MLIGMSQQQYQRAESGGDIRLSSLFRILEGLELELQLVPKGQTELESSRPEPLENMDNSESSAWQGFMQDLED